MPEAEGWGEPRGYDHTFQTGRVARLRVALPVSKLLREGVWSDELAAAFDLALQGELEDQNLAMRLSDALTIGIFVTPRVVADPPDGESVPEGAVPISWLDETEIEEAVRAAFGGPAIHALFRDQPADDGAVAGSSGVADSSVGAARPGAGKRRSTSSRRASGSSPA